MKNDVVGIVAELRQDHRNMRLLLSLIEREADKLFGGIDADFELLHDILRYLTVYPDAVHHPKEDLIYDEIRHVRPDLSGGFQRITVDHRNLADAGRRVRDQLEAINAGVMVERNAVVADALRYVNQLRTHMQWEELDLFNRCLKMAREGHQFLTIADAPSKADPLFGKDVESGFARLFDQIRDTVNENGNAPA